jgi:hypothetical protein
MRSGEARANDSSIFSGVVYKCKVDMMFWNQAGLQCSLHLVVICWGVSSLFVRVRTHFTHPMAITIAAHCHYRYLCRVDTEKPAGASSGRVKSSLREKPIWTYLYPQPATKCIILESRFTIPLMRIIRT